MSALTSADMMRQALSAGRYDNVQNTAFSPQQVNKAAAESSQVLGHTLEVMQDPMAELTDSLEELSMQFEEKTMKSIGDRKLGEKRGPNAAYLTAVQKWQKVLPDMPGGPFMERMLRQLRAMKAAHRAPGGEDLLRMLGEGSKDPAHQFAMLDLLEQAFGKDDADLARAATAAKRILERTKGREIRAGLNVAEEVNARAKDAGEMQELRDLYRGEVLGYESPQACFRSLLAKEGAGRMPAALDFLVKGCGIDLHSPNPSKSPEELRRIILDLQCVNVLTATLDRANALVGKMAPQFGEVCRLDGERLTGTLLDLTEKPFVDKFDVQRLIESCGLRKPLARLYFCMGLMDLVRSLSSRLFADEENRIRLVEAGQEHLDELVLVQEKEDAAAGAGGTA